MLVDLDDADKQFPTAPEERLFALTAPQIPIWIDQSLYPQKPIYSTGQTLTLRTALDIDRFVGALHRVVAENDALRLRFIERDGDILQHVVNDVPVHLEFSDFSGETDPEATARAWIEKVFWGPLGATDFPLFQFALAKLSTDHFLWLQKYHHLIMDATGRRLVAARVAAVYDSLSVGAEPPPADGSAYVVLAEAAEDQYLASDNWTADEEYWRTRFTDLPESLVKIDARLSEKSRSGRPMQFTCSLSREASDALRMFARRQGSTVFRVILALTWCCFGRLYRSSDLIFGVPLANRKGADAKRTVGQFAKVMPFRARLDPTMTFAAALSALDIDLSNDLRHQRFPFHYTNGLLRPQRGPNYLYDVIVNYQRNDYGFSFGGAPVICSNSSVGFAVPWSITAFEYAAGDTIHLVIGYDPGRISPEEAMRFVRCFQELLRGAPGGAEIAIGQLPMVSAQERAELMRIGQGERVALPEGATLPMLLARQAARSPNATALVYGEERLTYAELHARADRLARRLLALGVGPDMLVGISLPRTIVLIVAILAVHKAGAAYLPLDPSYPQQRLVFMVEDSNTKIVLTDRAQAVLLTGTGAQLLLLDELPAEDAQELPAFGPGNGVEPTHLAYLLYTSGSTGKPKGIAVTHGAAANLVLSSRNLIDEEDVSGVLFATSVNFDISVYEVFLPLACGGAIILVENLFALTTAPARDEVRLVNTVPSLMNTFLQGSSLPVGVRVVNLAGEALPRALADRIFADRTDVRLFNFYGPTETTVYSTWSAVDRNDRRSPPIGGPLWNTEVYVLDEFLQLVPEGGIGELCIGGMGLSQGYLNRPELTQQRFVANPFGEDRIYKTGDLVRWLSDRQLGFVGRVDHQTKIRGCRIELGEIESVLNLHPAVRDSVLVVRRDASGDETLVAYVMTASSYPILISELRTFLKQKLPAYMLPSAFVLMDAFPVTPSGKMDRNALPLPSDGRTANPLESHVAPRTPTEVALAGIWCEVLKLNQVAIHDNFFEWGGHSLLAMQVVSRVSKALAVELPLRAFFDNPTISSLAVQIETHLCAGKGSGSALGSQEPIVEDQRFSREDDPPGDALPRPYGGTLDSLGSYVAPRTPTEEALAGIWCQVLKLKQVDIHGNFFEWGGHSLLAMRVISRVSDALAVELSLRTFFENPTISSLAVQIDTLVCTNGGALGSREPMVEDQPLSREDAGASRPLSFGQERLWFLDQLEPHSAIYNIPMMLGLEGALDASVLRRSLEEVVRRHEALRTRFETIKGSPVQVIAPVAALEMPLIDMSDLPQHEREAEVSRLCRKEAQRPFDLRRDLMLRASVFRLDPRRHVLLLNLHHIASDGWSVAVLLRELGSLYGAFCQRQPSPLAELPVQYGDFAMWQRDWFQGGGREKQFDYWRKQLAGAPLLLELPTDRPRPARQSHRGATETAVFPDSLLIALKALGQKEGTSLFMTLLAAFQVLLSRYSGQEDITVGSPTAGRNRVEFEALIGFFVNTLVLRGDLSGNPTFRELLRRVRETTLEAYAQQDFPFEKLVQDLKVKRNLSYSPLFQVLFALQNTPSAPRTLGGLDLNLQWASSATSKFDLSMLLRQDAEGLRARLEYCTDLFDRDTILRLLNHFRTLLEGIVATPDARIDELPLLTTGERHQLLVEWNNTHADPPIKTVAELFEEQAAQTPSAVAIVSEQSEITYAELNAQANQLAHYLKGLGVGPERIVAVSIERSSELIVILLGILKAGGAYLALDPHTPSKRLQSILEDAQPTVIVVQSELQKVAIETLALAERWRTEVPPIVVCLEQNANAIRHESTANPCSGATLQTLAYICFTSGSTGRPKGVSILHRGVVRLVKNTNYIAVSAADVFLQLAPVSFDASTFEIWACLLNGARLVVLQSEMLSLGELGAAIRKHRVSVLWLTAGMFHLMVDHELDSLKGVRQLLAGGDVLSTVHVRKALEALGEGRLINGYGPTENTTFTCCHSITGSSVKIHSIPIGRPISNTQCFILDRNLLPVPVGVRGEVFIGGDGLARGYLNDPKLTAEKFIQNPFRPNALLYRTGDFARYLADGNIEFLGRVDHQVKIRGFRVELGEIEAILTLHPAVRESVVAVFEDPPNDKKLVAYVTPADASAKFSELRSFLKDKLPVHMLPSAFISLDALPLTPQGKLDRKALLSLQSGAPEVNGSYIAPRTPTEEALAGIWRELLDLKQVSVQDDFFELGGRSLIAVRVISEINQTLKVNLSVLELFHNPTVEQVARVIDERLLMNKPRPAVTQLQEGSTELPVYFIYAGPDQIRFAQLISPAHQVFGIEVPWPLAWRNAAANNETSALPTMEQMVAPYVTALIDHTRSSSCVLAGFSFAGLMAFEAAHQLQSQGGSVEMVILLDSWVKFPTRYQVAWRKLQRDWKQVLNGPPAARASRSIGSRLSSSWLTIWSTLAQAKSRLWHLAKRAGQPVLWWIRGQQEKRLGPLTGFLDEEGMPLRWGLVYRLYRNAMKNYRPHRLDCRAILFRAEDEKLAGAIDESLGWKNLFTEGLEIVPVAGDHQTMSASDDLTLAREMNEALNRVYTSRRKKISIHARGLRPVSVDPETGSVVSLDGVDR